MFVGFDTTGERVPLGQVGSLLAPVIPRSKVVAVGKNYREHAAEMGGEAPAEPLLFLKPNTSVIGLGDAIVVPAAVEAGRLRGRAGRRHRQDRPQRRRGGRRRPVFGYTVANDVTARDLQKSDGQWTRAKGFDTFCPLGPVIETELDRRTRTCAPGSTAS